MSFLAPSFLHLAWLALIPLVLYLFRRKARRVAVSTLLFYRTLAREHQESAWLRRIKRWLSLLLTLAVLWLGVLALSRPTRDDAADTPGAVVLLLDRSASMSARNESGRTRLEEAVAQLRKKVRDLPDAVVASLMVFDSKPVALLSRSRNRRELLRLLDEVKVMPGEGQAEVALESAQRVAALDPPAEIWIASDDLVPRGAGGKQAAVIRQIPVALPQPVNAGITGFQLRKAPLARDRYEGFVRVTASASNPEPVTSTLEVRIGGRLVQLREVEMKPAQSVSLILPLEGARGQEIEIGLRTAGDCLGLDDVVVAALPELKPLLVAWVAEQPDPFVSLALSSMAEAGRLDILKGGPANWPLTSKPDVYVFENWLPGDWPTDRPVIVLNPPVASGPVRASALASAVPSDVVRAVNAEHPVLFRVTSSRVELTQTAVLESTPGLEPLWLAGQETVLAAGEVSGQRLVVTAFSPSQSEQLALLPAFPLVLGNAIYWCAEGGESLSGLRTSRPGDWLAAEGLVQWSEWDGRQTVASSDAAQAGGIELRRLGAWKTADGRSGTSLLASEKETNLARAEAKGKGDPVLLASALGDGGGDWSRRLIWLLLALLVAESFLFHRQAVY
jgi:hypothetical protein